MKTMKIYFVLIFLLLFGNRSYSQTTIYCNDEYVKSITDFKETDLYFHHMWYLCDLYFWTYLSFPTTPEDLFFHSTDTQLSGDFFDWVHKNISYFDIKTNGNILEHYYKDSLLLSYTPNLECNKFTYEPNFFRFIRMFDESNKAMENVYIDSCFEERHRKIMFDNVLKFHEQYGYEVNFPTNDSCYSDSSKNDRYAQRALLVYDNGKLSVHDICKECITLEENDYIESLKEIAEMYCKEYNCKRIIFSAIILKKGK